VRSMPAHADITSVRELLSERLSDKGFTSLQWWQTRRTSYVVARDASSMLDKLTSLRKCFRPSPSHGLLLCGTLI
jgi:hypothetical protein